MSALSILRHLLVAGAICLGCAASAVAQEADPIGDLRTPPSPAFNLLGVEPSAVERPATPADFALTLISKAKEEALPKNYALEATPYWLKSHARETWRNDQGRRSIGQSLAKTTSLSFGTAETGTTDAPVTSLALGLRTLLFSGRLAQRTIDALEALEAKLQREGELVLQIADARGLTPIRVAEGELGVRRGLLAARLKSATDAGEREQIAAEIAAVDARAKALSDDRRRILEGVLASKEFLDSTPMKNAKAFAVQREGFFLELAAGTLWDFAQGQRDSGEYRKHAIWVTPSYAAGKWSVLGVLRAVHDRTAADTDVLDAGGRVIFTDKLYALSLEYVRRGSDDAATATDDKHRLVGLAERKLREGTWLVASFGRDHTRAAAADTLVAQLGLSVSLSKERHKFGE